MISRSLQVPGSRLVGVDHQIGRALRRTSFGMNDHFSPVGNPAAAAPAQPGLLDLLDDPVMSAVSDQTPPCRPNGRAPARRLSAAVAHAVEVREDAIFCRPASRGSLRITAPLCGSVSAVGHARSRHDLAMSTKSPQRKAVIAALNRVERHTAWLDPLVSWPPSPCAASRGCWSMADAPRCQQLAIWRTWPHARSRSLSVVAVSVLDHDILDFVQASAPPRSHGADLCFAGLVSQTSA